MAEQYGSGRPVAEPQPGGKAGGTAPFAAVLFDLDGVLTDTARAHGRAWAATFDAFLQEWSSRNQQPFRSFTREDYLAYVDGKPREDGIRAFLAARQIELPEGLPSDGPDQRTLWGLSARKNAHFLDEIRAHGVGLHPAALPLLERLRQAGLRLALVTSSRNGTEVLEIAGLADQFDTIVDGVVQQALSLRGKPAPDAMLEAAGRLGVPPERAVVVEDAVAGIAAAYDGGVGLVVGIDSGEHKEALFEAGADAVLDDLSQLLALATSVGPAIRSEDIRRLDPFRARTWQQGERAAAVAEGDGWLFVAEGYDPALEGRRETLFAVGNGSIVTRGAAAEAEADGVHYPGTYLAGGYNRLRSDIAGRSIEHEDLVNLPNWLPFTFRVDGGDWLDRLDREDLELLECRRTLDLRKGLYGRIVRLRDGQGRITRIEERRFVSMANRHLAGQYVGVTAENWSGRLTLKAGINGGTRNAGVARYQPFDGRHFRVRDATESDFETLVLRAETIQSRLEVVLTARLRLTVNGERRLHERQAQIDHVSAAQEIDIEMLEGDEVALEKVVAIHSSRDPAIADPDEAAHKAAGRAGSFEELLDDHARAWAQLWRRFDLVVETERAEESRSTQLAVRLHIFHLLQTVSPHTSEVDAGLPARGWHGEGYRGHIFWDELFIHPYLSLRAPALARALLLYRHRRLPEARWAAREAGFEGAMFPWQSGSDGREETDTLFLNPLSGNWIEDNTHLQRHVGAAIAYTVWSYWQATGDSDFLYACGAELLLEIARFWASIAEWNAARGRYDIRGIIGPDEFHDRYPGREEPGLDNNAYTNVMASWCLARAGDLLEALPRGRRQAICERLRLESDEIRRWDQVSRRLYVPFNNEGLISQFEGYEALEEFDWPAYRSRYGSIMRLDLILESEGAPINRFKLSKQADLLMLFYLFSAEQLQEMFDRLGYVFDPGSIPRTIDHYLQRTSHGSTLSSIVHAWVLARSCRCRSWRLFGEALRSDIDDVQGGTTAEGIHLGAMAGTVDLLQRCYTGMELRGDRLHFNPALPSELTRLSFSLEYRRQRLNVEATPTSLTVSSDPDNDAMVPVVVGKKRIELHPGQSRSVGLAEQGIPVMAAC